MSKIMTNTIYKTASASAVLAASLMAFSAQALPLIDFQAGASGWLASPSGEINDDSARQDVDSVLGLEDKASVQAYVSLEHPVPIIPNVRLSYTSFKSDGTLNSNITIAGNPITASEDSSLDLTMLDATAYYGLGLVWVSADVGLTIRQLDATLTAGAESKSGSLTFPMLYAKGRIDLPFTDTYAIAEAQGVGYSGNSLMDYNIRVGYDGFLGLGLEAGYRSLSVTLDDVDDLTADFSLTGPFLGVQFSF